MKVYIGAFIVIAGITSARPVVAQDTAVVVRHDTVWVQQSPLDSIKAEYFKGLIDEERAFTGWLLTVVGIVAALIVVVNLVAWNRIVDHEVKNLELKVSAVRTDAELYVTSMSHSLTASIFEIQFHTSASPRLLYLVYSFASWVDAVSILTHVSTITMSLRGFYFRNLEGILRSSRDIPPANMSQQHVNSLRQVIDFLSISKWKEDEPLMNKVEEVDNWLNRNDARPASDFGAVQ